MTGKKTQKKQAPSFTATELEILLEEVALDKGMLLSSFHNTVSNRSKQQLWEDIARKMAASSLTPQREWDVVRKELHDFMIFPLQPRPEGIVGGSSVAACTPSKDKALEILGESASQYIFGGIDIRDGEGVSCQVPLRQGHRCKVTRLHCSLNELTIQVSRQD